MNSLIAKDGRYVGQYLHIKDSDFSIRMFTKFYNLATQEYSVGIDNETAKDLIHTSRYCTKTNKIYVNNANGIGYTLKSVNVGDFMVFIQETRKLFIFNQVEFMEYMEDNGYDSDISVTYILGVDNGVQFDNMRVIVANTLQNAKSIYMKRYNTVEPVCIGTIEDGHLLIISDKYKFKVPLIM